jgi:hypothetical protein
MKIRFSNPFLAILGTIFYIISWFTNSLGPSFMFGLCFGMIYLNYKDEKNNR